MFKVSKLDFKFVYLFLFVFSSLCAEESIENEPPSIGNFSLPTSQQPAGLFAFGGNVIDEDEVQLFFFADGFIGNNRINTDLIPSILYGVTDNFSILLNIPYTPVTTSPHVHSSGVEDAYMQWEYAFYNQKNANFINQATFVGNITVPTGSPYKRPPTGYGSPSVFIGGTFYHMRVDWFAFTGQGAILTTTRHHTKIGEQFLYQFGIGKNLPSPKDWIFAWMLELDGQYQWKNRISGITDPNSGGNIIYATPSLWISSKDIFIQLGLSFPLTQHWYGHQNNYNFGVNLNLAWSFY